MRLPALPSLVLVPILFACVARGAPSPRGPSAPPDAPAPPPDAAPAPEAGALAPPLAPGQTSDDRIAAAGARALAAIRSGRADEARRRLREFAAVADRPAERAWVAAELRRFGEAELHKLGEAAAGRGAPIGVAVPLSGRLRAIGEASLAGALEAAGAFDLAGPAALEISDSSSDAAAAVRDLAARAVSAVVGGLDAAEDAAVANAARAQGIRHVTLLPPDASSRAHALGEEAARAGLRRVVAFAPAGPYGDAVLAGFRARATVVAEQRYAADAKSFDAVARAAAGAKPDGVFVGDAASRLEMIAAALAAARLWSAAPGAPAPPKGFAAVRVFATAEGASPRLLRAARYLQGALLAPGFYPDEDDAATGPFTLAFARARGRAPGLGEAVAYAAVLEARGLARPDWPALYVVEGERVRAVR